MTNILQFPNKFMPVPKAVDKINTAYKNLENKHKHIVKTTALLEKMIKEYHQNEAVFIVLQETFIEMYGINELPVGIPHVH